MFFTCIIFFISTLIIRTFTVYSFGYFDNEIISVFFYNEVNLKVSEQ